MLATASKYTVTPGLFVQSIGPEEIFIASGGRLTSVSGPVNAITSFVKQFQSDGGASFDDAFASLQPSGDSKPAREDFKRLFNALVESAILVPSVAPRKTYERVVVISRFPLDITDEDLTMSSASSLSTYYITPEQNGETLAASIEHAGCCDIVVAAGLHEYEFYKINRALAPQRRPWIFAEWSASKAVVSPVLDSGNFACYECLRLRRLGTVRDVMQNVMLEERISRGLAPDVSAMRNPSAPERRLMSALVLRRLFLPNVPSEDKFLVADFNTGSVRDVLAARIPDCVVCSAAQGALHGHS